MTISKEFKVGLAFSIALILLVGILSWTGNLDTKTRVIYVMFEDLQGLKTSDKVMYRGMEVGYVSSLLLVDNGIKGELRVDEEVKLYQDASAGIGITNLMNVKKINLYAGNPSTGRLQEGTVLKGENTVDISNLVTSAGRVLDSLSILSRYLSMSLTNINSIVTDRNLKINFNQTMNNLKVSSSDIRNIASKLKDSNLLNVVETAYTTTKRANQFLIKYDEILDTTAVEIQRVVKKIDTLLQIVNPIASKLSTDKESLAGKLLNDKEFTNKIDSAVKRLNYLLKQTEENQGIPVRLRIF